MLVFFLETSEQVVKNAYDAYHEGEADQKSFDTLLRAPLLLSSEVDQLIQGLRREMFFDVFKYDAQRGDWVHNSTSSGGDGGGAAEESPSSEPYSGLLLKRADRVKDWRQRFFTIHVYHQGSRRAAELRYFEKAQDSESTWAKPKVNPKGTLALQGATIADGKGDVEFSVSSSGGEKYLLRAHTREAKDAWKRKLLEAKSWSQQHVS